jgi:DNA modification methylase
VVTSPPYWGLRDYGVDGQLGLEETPEDFVAAMVGVFREVWRVLRDDGTLWLNLGDSYSGSGHGGNPDGSLHSKQGTNAGCLTVQGRRAGDRLRPKNLIGIPWLVAFALQREGWILRSDIVWSKPNPMPESVTDRPSRAHEFMFLLTKSPRYFYDAAAIREAAPWAESHGPGTGVGYGRRQASDPKDARQNARDRVKRDKQRGHSRRHAGFNERWDQMTRAEQQANGRNKRSVWTIATQPRPEAHFATFPDELARTCIRAGSKPGDVVLDPFAGSGTTVRVARGEGRHGIGLELNPDYARMAVAGMGDFQTQLVEGVA